MASRILRLPIVLLRTGLSRSTVYARVAEGTFPRQLSLGPNTVGWRETDIDRWIDSLTSIRTALLGVGDGRTSLAPELAQPPPFARYEGRARSR